MTSKEEYIANMSSNSFACLTPRKRTQEEIDLMTSGKLLKVKSTDIYQYQTFDLKTQQQITIEKHSGDKFKANTIVNKFKNYVEIVHYKEEFDCVLGRKELIYNEQGEKILKERPRTFIMQDGSLVPKGIVDWDKVALTNIKSFHRSLDNFYGYVLSNTWKYFVTFTFSPKKVNRLDDEQVKYAFKKFRQVLQYINKDAKVIVVPQYHEKIKAIHFHGFIGNIDLTRYLSLLRNKFNDIVKSKCGEPLYDLSLYKYGYCSVAILPDNYNEQQIANYCIRYITRDERTGYAKKAYYRTTNLDFKDKVITYYSREDLFNLVNDLEVEVHKEKDNMIVYRKYIKS